VFGLPGPWWAWLGTPLLAAATAAAVVELTRKRPLLESASILDEKLGLKDRLGSALALGTPGSSGDPFVTLALAESEAVAPTVDPAKAVPIRFGSSWWTWPALVAAGIAGALWLPESSILKAKEQRQVAAVAEKKEQSKAAEEIHQALDAARQAASADTTKTAAADALAARRLAALEKLEEELRAGKINAGEARERSAKALEESAAELEKKSAESQRAADATRDRLAALSPPSGQAAGDAARESDLTRAVRRGDLRAAREAARDLMQKVDELSPEERAKAARDMEELARDLARKQADEQRAGAPPKDAASDASPSVEKPAAAGADRALEEELRSQGLSEEQAKDAADAPSEEAAKKKLEDLGLPPEAADKLAKKIEADSQRRRAEETAKQRTDELSKSLEDAADRLRDQQPPESAGATPPRPEPSPGAEQKPDAPKRGTSKPNEHEQAKPKPEAGHPNTERPPQSGQPQASPGQPQAGGQQQQGAEKPGGENAGHAQPKHGDQGTKPEEKANAAGDRQQGAEKKDGSGPTGQKEEENQSRGVNKPGTPDPSKPATGRPSGGAEKTKQATPEQGEAGKPGEKKEGAEQSSSHGKGDDGAPRPNAGKQGSGPKPSGEPKPDAAKKPGAGEQTKGELTKGEQSKGEQTKGESAEPREGGGDQPKDNATGKQKGSSGEEKRPADQKGAQGAEEKNGAPRQGTDAAGAEKTGTPDQQDRSAPSPRPKDGAPPGADQKQDATKQPGASGDQPAPEKNGATKPDNPGATKNEQQQGDAPSAEKKPGGAKEQPAGERRAGSERQQQPQQRDGGRTPNLDDLPSPSSLQGKALKKIIENLRNMEQDRTDAAKDRQASKEMRDRAQKMLENATPEQRKKLEQWAKEFAKESPRQNQQGIGERAPGDEKGEGRDLAADGPRDAGAGVGDKPGSQAGKNQKLDSPREPAGFKTDFVDARPKDGAPTEGRIAGELPGDGKPGAPMLSKQETQEAIQRAKQGAQRAIDDRTIPGRYDRLLRRYFQRLPAKVKNDEKHD
jgi:hypothetical protein